MFVPKFLITPNILTNIAKIEACKAIIENAPLVPSWEAQFRQEAMVRAVYHGTHIEGNKLNLEEAQEVLDGRPVEGRARDIQEIINYRNVVKYMDVLRERGDKQINLEEALYIHKLVVDKILPEEAAGQFRQKPVLVKNMRTGEVSFTPPQSVLVPHLVNEFLTWLNAPQHIHPIIKAAICHYELARIHPFLDGNGRWARAMATLVLFLEGYDIKRFFTLDEYYDRNAHKYYLTLQHVSNQILISESGRDMTEWIDFFCEGLMVELAKVKEKVLRLSGDARLREKVGQLALSERQVKIMEYLQNYGRISNSEWQSLLPDVSDDTILRDMKFLISKNLIRKKGHTKASIYILR